MTLLDIQRRFREVGRIRTGEKAVRGTTTYPRASKTFILTSSDRDAIDAAAAKYGGAVEAFTETEWKVKTEADRLEVMLPPQGMGRAYSLAYELWSGGGLVRRCDGRDALVNGEDSPCLCDPDGRECHPTLRASFLLPDLPGLGVWRLDAKGYNAAAEIPGALDLLAMYAASGRPMRAILRLEERKVKREGETHKFIVPVIDPISTLTEMVSLAPPGETEPLALPGGVPALPWETESSSEAPAVATPQAQSDSPAPSGVESMGTVSSASDDGLSDPNSEVVAARYAYARAATGAATNDAVDQAAQDATGQTLFQMDTLTWQAYARVLRASANESPPEAAVAATPPPAVDGAAEVAPGREPEDGALQPSVPPASAAPPKPGTAAYRALDVAAREAARTYWRGVPA